MAEKKQSVVKIENLHKHFKVGDIEIPALNGVNLTINSGEFVVVFGPSGCGKTTLLNLIAGLEPPTSGKILFRGEDLGTKSPKAQDIHRRSKIGMIFQAFNLIAVLNALENVAFPLTLSGIKKKDRLKRAKELLSFVGLKERMYNRPLFLSGGEQQRVAIARALANNPWVILADEPTGNLDSKAAQEIIALLTFLNQKWKRTIVLATHNPMFFDYADKVCYMKDGQIQEVDMIKGKINEEDKNHRGPLSYWFQKQGRFKFFDVLQLSLKHFRGAKVRTTLTLFGVSVGVSAIVFLVSLGIGLKDVTVSQAAPLESLNNLSVAATENKKITDDDIARIEQIEKVKQVSPALKTVSQVTFNDITTESFISGFYKDDLEFWDVDLVSGGAFSSNDANEIIIPKIAQRHFNLKPEEFVGRTITLNVLPKAKADLFSLLAPQKIDFKIVGVSSDETIFTSVLPIETLKKIEETDTYGEARVKAKTRSDIGPVRDKIESLGFRVTTLKELVEQIEKAFLVLQIVLGSIGGIAFLVSCFGIINTMIISLLEHTHEIGILRALGAGKKDVKRIFYLEAALYGIIGGVFGVILGWMGGQSINLLLRFLANLQKTAGEVPTLFVTPLNFSLFIISFAVSISLLAGVYPARRAATLSPLDALRNE